MIIPSWESSSILHNELIARGGLDGIAGEPPNEGRWLTATEFSSLKHRVFGLFPLPLPSFHKQREVVFSLRDQKFPVSPRYFLKK